MREMAQLSSQPLLFCFLLLLLAQIKGESNALATTFLVQGTGDQHRHAAAILPEQLLLIRLDTPGCSYFCQGAFVALAPFSRRQIRPAHTSRGDIFTVILHHTEKSFIGLDNGTVEPPDHNCHDVGVDQAPSLSFTLSEISVEPGVLQRNGGLGY